MKFCTFSLFILSLISVIEAQAETAFTYQGQLSQAGQPANGQYDMSFELYDALAAGQQVGVTLTQNNIEVTAGVFDVLLDFGDAPFNNAARWLEIDVREAGGGNYTTLSPRQRVGAAPFAIETLFVAPGAVDTAAIQDDAVTRAKIGNDAVGTAQIENNTVTSSDIRDGSITADDVAGGLYNNKSALYEVFGPTLTVNLLPESQSVVCQDTNDLPIWGGCRSLSINGFIATSAQRNDWSNPSVPASVTCSIANVHPSNPTNNPVSAQAHMICLAVD